MEVACKRVSQGKNEAERLEKQHLGNENSLGICKRH
jgi:hypothetical protein